MKKIVISQRQDHFIELNETREGVDTRLLELMVFLDFVPLQLSSSLNKKMLFGLLNEQEIDGIILSGGNDIGVVPSRDALESNLLMWSVGSGVPVLGICRGMQYINFHQGGTLTSVNNHLCTKHCLIGDKRFNGLTVTSYHNYGIYSQDMGVNLDPIAWTSDGVIEALECKNRRWLGVMWHPEREEFKRNIDADYVLNHFRG